MRSGRGQRERLRVGGSSGCTYCQPNRPLTQSMPLVTEWSAGEVTFTITDTVSGAEGNHDFVVEPYMP